MSPLLDISRDDATTRQFTTASRGRVVAAAVATEAN